jgi:hypothetical protein
MIPLIAIIRIRRPHGSFSLWLPVFLLWPLLVLLTPVLAATFMARRVNPVVGLAGLGGLLGSSSGLRLEVESPSASVQVRVI